MTAAAGYPVNEAFRRQVRERALEVARGLTLSRGWQQVRFIEVAMPTAAASLEVVVRDGVRIVVTSHFDAALLRRVVDALEAR